MDIELKIYEASSNGASFNSNGLGFLTDVISAEVKEEINGEYTLTIEYPIKGHLAEYLVRENIIKCSVDSDGTKDLFRIKYIDRNFNTLLVQAYQLSYDLADDLVIDTAPTNLNAQAFGRWVLSHSTTHAQEYTFTSDIATLASARYIRKNVLECFLGADNSMLNKFGGEFYRNQYNIALYSRLGADNGVKLLVGKNIEEIKITIDDTSLYTRICPVGFGGLTIPEIYVDSPLISHYPFPKGCVIKFENIKYDETGEDPEAYDNLTDFYNALRAAANEMFTNGLDKPLINVAVDWVDLAKTKEYENFTSLETIRLGDTITCDLDDFKFQTRVIATTYDILLDRITSFQIGQPVATLATSMNATIREVESQDTSSLLQQAQENASNMLKNAMTGYIYFDYDNGNLYIMDNPDPDDAVKVWRWNLNGLGYSSTGINGTYGLAITMDGSIVADYITTGHLNTNVIQGYDSLVASVDELVDLMKTEEGTGSIQLDGAAKGVIHRLEITGQISKIFPSDSVKTGIVPYQNSVPYPSTTLYPKDTYLRVDSTDYHLDLNFLNYMSETIHDIYIVDSGKQWIERYVGIDANGDMYELPTPIIEKKEDLYIDIDEYSTITLLSFPSANLKAQYMKKNEYTENFASQAYVGSRITQTKNELDLEVQQKVNEDEIIAKLNLAIEDGKGIVELKGNTVIIDSDNFQLDETGRITATSGDIAGFKIDKEQGFVKEIYAPYDYTENDYNRLVNILRGLITPTPEDYEKYDFDDDGELSSADLLYLNVYIINGITTTRYGEFIITAPPSSKKLYDAKFGYIDGYGNLRNGIGPMGARFSSITLSQRTTPLSASLSPSYIQFYNNNEPSIVLMNETGNITCVSLTQTSQEKNKKNFEKYEESALKEIQNIDIYKYNLKDEDDNNKKHLGFVIGDKYKYSKEVTNNDNTGVDNYSFTSLLCKAIQEQQEQIEELKKEIKLLKGGKND